MMRIQKFLSNYGFCSRRQAEEYIKQGKVVLNGNVVKELGTKINVESDTIFVDGTKIKIKKTPPIYIALNKPKGYISSCKHKGQKTVIDLINIKERVYPVGRLDKDSTGLIILTNDGTLHHKLSHPSFNHQKEYEVVVDKSIKDSDLKKMAEGIVLDEKKTRPAKVSRIDASSFMITLQEGRNRQIRRMAEALNFKVVSLKRVRIESIKLDRLQPGKFRFLSDREVNKIIKK